MNQQAIYILGGSQTDFARNWQREGLDVYDMFSESLREAAQEHESSPEAIGQRLSRARRLIRECAQKDSPNVDTRTKGAEHG